ncbi:unnamed protein product, partial [Brenthis ino]
MFKLLRADTQTCDLLGVDCRDKLHTSSKQCRCKQVSVTAEIAVAPVPLERRKLGVSTRDSGQSSYGRCSATVFARARAREARRDM